MKITRTITALDLVCELDVCGLGLAVGSPRAVTPRLIKVVVMEPDAARAVSDAGHKHNARGKLRGSGSEQLVSVVRRGESGLGGSCRIRSQSRL